VHVARLPLCRERVQNDVATGFLRALIVKAVTRK
jgi:hypothetical protein